MDQFKLKMYPLIDINDLVELRKQRLIGNKLKPGLLSSTIIAVSGKEGSGAFAVRLRDSIEVRPTVATTIPESVIDDVMRGVAHTLYMSRPVVLNREPLYSAEEVSRGA